MAVGLFVLGVGLEVVQAIGIAAGREGEPLDALANGVGAAAAWALWSLLRNRMTATAAE